MKSSVKKLIIFLASIFLLLTYFGLRTYNSHNKDQLISREDQRNISEEESDGKQKFEILDPSNEEKNKLKIALAMRFQK